MGVSLGTGETSFVLGDGQPAVIVSLTGKDGDELASQARGLACLCVDLVEWRVDYLEHTDAIEELATEVYAAGYGRPLIATLRTKAQGGQRDVSADEYVELCCSLIRTGVVAAIDLESAWGADVLAPIMDEAWANDVRMIGSDHDFESTATADALVAQLEEMRNEGYDIVKLAVMPSNPGDVLALLNATWTFHQAYPATPLIAISMGELGKPSRTTGHVFGSCATFGARNEDGGSAPGQIPVTELAYMVGNLPASRLNFSQSCAI